jgi:thiamine biosynthesis lipoprotein
LRDASLSVSAIWGKAIEAEGKTYGHVIDPRSGLPVTETWLAAVALPSATEADALSTALLTVGRCGHDQIARLRPGIRTLAAGPNQQGGGFWVQAQGIELPD